MWIIIIILFFIVLKIASKTFANKVERLSQENHFDLNDYKGMTRLERAVEIAKGMDKDWK